ncbi:unnamed protein product [Rangifer tarandus platyrhynchus]|uniref:Uncharacterized protein n=1 Tax=Rangifer tarandus platyrhynchus TaxID=3082113 RepID=A0ABN8ZWL4_RANTA|nr:unnamed protein product [Rangifer tarandus platyrhynchus]
MKGGRFWPSGLSPKMVFPPLLLKSTLRLRIQSAQTPSQPEGDPLDQLGSGGLGEGPSHPHHTVHWIESHNKSSTGSVSPFPNVFRKRAVLKPSFGDIPL